MRNSKLVNINVLGILALLTACSIQVSEVEKEEVNLPLECHTVPNQKEQLCLGTTYSASAPLPVDDIVFYHRSEEGNLTFIHSYQGDVGVLYFDSFSTNGKLLVLGYAEEGHPSFIFHETQKYFAGDTKSIAYISKYEYTHLESVADNGDVIVGLMDGEESNEPLCTNRETLGHEFTKERCIIKYNIYDTPDIY